MYLAWLTGSESIAFGRAIDIGVIESLSLSSPGDADVFADAL